MSFKSLFTDPAPAGPVAINYGAEAVLASLKLRPVTEHQGQTFEQFLAERPQAGPVTVPVSTRRSGRADKPKDCREKCGRKASKGRDVCEVCADKAQMQHLAQVAEPLPIITCRASHPLSEPGQFTHREVITYKGQNFEFNVKRKGKQAEHVEPAQDYIGMEAICGDEYIILLNYAAGLVKRAEANDNLRELARIKAVPNRVFVSTHEERCEGLLREILAYMPLSWVLTYIETAQSAMPAELRDCVFRRAK